MFGDRFYPLLGRLSPWKQSLFALALAQRQYAHYLLWAELSQQTSGAAAFNQALTKLWQYHQDKFNHVDIEAALDAFTPHVPDLDKEPDPDDPSTGSLLAVDAALALTAACDAVLLHEGDEAEIASRASLAAAVLAARQAAPEFLDDEALRETDLVDQEVNFQVSLLELLQKAERKPEFTHFVLKTALKDGCSNIGLELSPEELNDCSFEHYAIPLESLKQAAAQGKSARPEVKKQKTRSPAFKHNKGKGGKFGKTGKAGVKVYGTAPRKPRKSK